MENYYDPRQFVTPGYWPNQYGQTYTPRPEPQNTQPLTNEQISELRQGKALIDWRISKKDLMRAVCTHKEKNGTPAIIPKGNNIWHCTICGADIQMREITFDEVQNAVNTIINMLQLSKAMYLDAPVSFVENYYQVIPILEKFPMLWKIVVDNYEMHKSYSTDTRTVGGEGNGFNILNNMFAFNPLPNQYYGYAPQPQPVPQPVPQNPNGGYYSYGPQDVYQPNAYQPQPIPQNPPYYNQNYMTNPGGNPFIYGGNGNAPTPGYIPPSNAPIESQGPNGIRPTGPTNDSGQKGNEIVQKKSFQV